MFIAVFNLVKTHGTPRLSKEYGIALVRDEQSHVLMYAFIFMSAKPFFSTSLLVTACHSLLVPSLLYRTDL